MISHVPLSTAVMLLHSLILGLVDPLESNVDALKRDPLYTVAILDFEAKGEEVSKWGTQIPTLITTRLSAEPQFVTVEREEINKLLSEQELGLSGTVSADTAARVGQLTGAKVIVTGRIFALDKEIMIVAKIIGVETSRVFGAMVRVAAGSSVATAAESTAIEVHKTVSEHWQDLVAKMEPGIDVIERLKKAFAGKQLPTVSVQISERHNAGPTLDPTAETEIALILQQLGFSIVDPANPEIKPDVEIIGEAFSEFGARRGNLFSCRARVEIKALQKSTGTWIAVDRQTEVAIDLGERIAGKKAIQSAAAVLAARIAPKIVEGR